MKTAILIFPHQLFAKNGLLEKDVPIYLVEHPQFFSSYTFHKKKILLHRASMHYYKNMLKKKGYKVIYLDYNDIIKAEDLYKHLKKDKIKALKLYNPIDHALEKELKKYTKQLNINLLIQQTPYFMTDIDDLSTFFENKKELRLYHFYKKQRKRFNILLTKQGKPVGGSWSYDEKNRKSLPNDIDIPKRTKTRKNKYIKQAEKYINKHFKKNPGNTESFIYPITHPQAKNLLSHFLEKYLTDFGPYQDAIAVDKPFLFHSLLSSSLNIGLLTPKDVIDQTLSYAKKHKIPLNSLEGFIRQITGWREFMWGTYYFIGQKQRKENFWKNKRSIPQSFYNGTTGIGPIDETIKYVLKNAYAHHIERLMILGNFMLLCEFNPKEVYTWFMELFIDAYDWVMVPNVFGMSQYADGGTITSKPYISSSNYILKMSDYKKAEWCNIWDGLYWHFIDKHKKVFAKEPRLKMMVSILKKMGKKKRESHLKTANKFLKTL